MKVFSRIALSAVLVGLSLPSVSFAQGPQRPVNNPPARPANVANQPVAPPNGTSIAVIDINKVFEQHARFKAQMDDIKKDITNYESTVMERRKAGAAIAEEMKTFPQGSPDFKAKEAQLTKMTADLQVEMTLKKKEFLEREAKVYFTAYEDVSREVTELANRYSIGLVLRYNSDRMDVQDRNSILQGVNRPVVYQHPDLDITKAIIERLNRGAAPATVGSRPAIPQTRRQ